MSTSITRNGTAEKNDREISGEQMHHAAHEPELNEGLRAWMQALGAFFVYTATWCVS